MNIPWLLAQTITGKEAKLDKALQRIGVESYLPKTRRRITDCNEHSYHTDRAFFPGYIFVRPDNYSGARLRSADLTLKCWWVDFGEGPVSIPNFYVEGIQARQDEHGYVYPDEVTVIHESYAKGQQLRITSGSATGLDALFVRDEDERVIVLLQMFGRMIETPLERGQVTAAYV